MSLSDDIEKVIALAVERREKTAARTVGVASVPQDGKISAWAEKIAEQMRDADRVTAADVARFLGADR
jgi:hypothetical protein